MAEGIPTIYIDGDGFVRADGLVIGRRIMRDGEIYLQVPDKDKRRASQRGSCFLEIPMAVLYEAMQWDWSTSFAP